MRIIFIFSILFGVYTNLVSAAEVASLLGSPDASLDFVQSLVKQSISLGTGGGAQCVEYEKQSSTWSYSILAREGVLSTVSIELTNSSGVASESDIVVAIGLADQLAPVAYTNVGPVSDLVCQKMSEHPQTAYVVIAGNGGSELDKNILPFCLSPNILFVTALNQETLRLEGFANWSATLVRLAVASHQIKVVGVGGMSSIVTNSTVAVSLAASRLAVLARKYNYLRGSSLIEEFLKQSAVTVPALEGKVFQAKALLPTS